MSLLLGERLSQEPRYDFRPPAVSSDAELAIYLAAAYGLVPDEWQKLVLERWLARAADGRWASLTCGLSVPRQNGKNAIIEIRELYGMVALGEKFLHTAHEVKTARKAFKRLKSFFGEKADDSSAKYPELNALVVEVRNTNGQEAVVLSNGGSCEFIARSKNSGRGYTVDVLVCDEAQEESDDDLEALVPTTSAPPLRNPQWLFTGTPPGPRASGEVFTKVRRDGVASLLPRLSWQEWSVESLEAARAIENVYRVNPGLAAGRLQVDVIQGEQDRFSIEGFARERGGLWLSVSASAVISETEWLAVHDAQSRRGSEDVVFAVDAELDRSAATISVSTQSVVDGRVHVELTDPGRDEPFSVPEAGERLIELARRRKPRAVVLVSGSPAASLIPVLKANNVPLMVLSASQARAACGAFLDALKARTLVHTGMQTELNDSVKLSKKHLTAAGWTWAEDPGTAPLRSVTWAHFGWTAQPPPPSTTIRRVR